MKIALLNLPFDNNYGGNLQRYALMTVLQRMGHDVEHIFLRICYKLPWYKVPRELPLRLIKKYILRRDIDVFWERKYNVLGNELADKALPFYKKYIKHTAIITDKSEIASICANTYDAYVVGSDQVWREDMTCQLGIENYFLGFVNDLSVKKIAYAVSLGSSSAKFSSKHLPRLSALYGKFTGVSYREISAKSIFERYGWCHPKPELVLDPTLLLSAEDYDVLFKENVVCDYTSGKTYCYILDQNELVQQTIMEMSKRNNNECIIEGIADKDNYTSIPQWIFNIRNASLIITDSYHGTVFSIIYHKPFVFLGNERRGNARVESLFSTLCINYDGLNPVICGKHVYQRIEYMKKKSILFLGNNLRK